jgi:hypothetical protein
MGGTGYQTGVAQRSRPAPAAQVHAGVEFGREADVTRDHQDQPARSACPREVTGEGGAVGVLVVAQDHTGLAAGQAGDGGAWVGQALVVGEQPQAGKRVGAPAKAPG